MDTMSIQKESTGNRLGLQKYIFRQERRIHVPTMVTKRLELTVKVQIDIQHEKY